MLGWEKHKLESRLQGEISITSGMQMTPPLRQKAKRNWRGLDKGERREWKIQLKTQHSKDEDHGIQSRLLMANRGGNNRSSNRLFSWAPNHWGWRLQPWNEKMFAPWKKSYGQPKQHIKKQRHYFANKVKVCLVKAMVFPVVMYGSESWTLWQLSAKELILLNCGVGEDSWESLGLQEDPTSPS